MEELTRENVEEIINEIRCMTRKQEKVVDLNNVFICVGTEAYYDWMNLLEKMSYSFLVSTLNKVGEHIPVKGVITFYSHGIKIHIFEI